MANNDSPREEVNLSPLEMLVLCAEADLDEAQFTRDLEVLERWFSDHGRSLDSEAKACWRAVFGG